MGKFIQGAPPEFIRKAAEEYMEAVKDEGWTGQSAVTVVDGRLSSISWFDEGDYKHMYVLRDGEWTELVGAGDDEEADDELSHQAELEAEAEEEARRAREAYENHCNDAFDRATDR